MSSSLSFGLLIFKLCLIQFTWTISSAQDVTISPEGQVVVVEGESFNITCTDGTSTADGSNLGIFRNMVRDNTIPEVFKGAENTFFIGPVDSGENGTVFWCRHLITADQSPTLIVLVQISPVYTISPDQPTTVVEGGNYSYTFDLTASPSPTDFNWTKDGVDTGGNGRIVTTETSITITNVMRSDSGTYQVFSTNSVGTGTANFTLDVQYPPELSVVPVVRNLSTGGVFTLNCTPVSNPPASVRFYFNSVEITSSSDSVNITGYVLTIPSITRKQRGTYSCNVNNSVGSDSVEVNVTVNVPPTPPRSLSFSNPQPFSSNVSWSPPEDNGGDPNPLTYRINVTNDTVTMMYNTSGLELQLTNLWHSRSYNVRVVAVNMYGTSPPAEMVLTTPDSVPIIDKVSVKALNLSRVLVNITLLTDGGQRVMYYEVEINGSTVQYTSSDTELSFVADGYTLSNNMFYNATIIANNSVGLSEQFNYEFFVPNPPIITMAPTSLDPSTIQTCCAGVKLNLEDPNDPTLVVKVYRNGVLHPNTSREGDNLFIPGLQAGREYTFRVSVKNVFGTSEQNVTVTPLLGRPSNPARPTVTSDGTRVTVVLSTDYPGTERMRSGSMFSFQLQFTKDGRSARQSDTQVVPATPSGLSSPVTTTYQGVLSGGSYTVRVTAVNEHGSSESVVSEEFVVTEPTQTPDSTPVIVGVVIGVVVAILLVIIIIFVGVILYMKFWKNKGHYLMKKESDTPSNYATNGSSKEKGEIEMLQNQPAVLYAAVDNSKMSQKEKDAADGHYDDPDVTKPPTTEGLVYADLEFTKRTTDYKKPPPKAEETVIYSEVTLQQQPPQGGSDRDERTTSPTTIM